MLYNPQKHHRRSIRLKGYDYSQAGAYFVTMCVRNRGGVTPPLLGDVADKRMRLNEFGEIVVAGWHGVTDRFMNVETDAFTAMPNHIHGIVIITDVGAGLPRPYRSGPYFHHSPLRIPGISSASSSALASSIFSPFSALAVRGSPTPPCFVR